ncbi:hypothetical protein Tco_1556752 [Tanacetum coccineum]
MSGVCVPPAWNIGPPSRVDDIGWQLLSEVPRSVRVRLVRRDAEWEDEEIEESYRFDSWVEGPGMNDEGYGLDDESRGLGYGALRHRKLALEEGDVYSTFEVGQDSGSVYQKSRDMRRGKRYGGSVIALELWAGQMDSQKAACVILKDEQVGRSPGVAVIERNVVNWQILRENRLYNDVRESEVQYPAEEYVG